MSEAQHPHCARGFNRPTVIIHRNSCPVGFKHKDILVASSKKIDPPQPLDETACGVCREQNISCLRRGWLSLRRSAWVDVVGHHKGRRPRWQTVLIRVVVPSMGFGC